jgi:hypothetical protein
MAWNGRLCAMRRPVAILAESGPNAVERRLVAARITPRDMPCLRRKGKKIGNDG